MEMYREMSKTMEALKDIMPDMGDMSSLFSGFAQTASEASGDENSSPFGDFDMMGMLMNMLTPEQKEMFQLFGGNHHDE